MDEFIYRWERPEGAVTLSWVGQVDVVPARVYALAFLSPKEMLLVSEEDPGDPHRYLPGGGVEDGETAAEALARELIEEADATIVTKEVLGSQRMIDPKAGQEFHRYYWCRVTLDDQVFPRTESTLRHIV